MLAKHQTKTLLPHFILHVVLKRTAMVNAFSNQMVNYPSMWHKTSFYCLCSTPSQPKLDAKPHKNATYFQRRDPAQK